MNYYKVAIAFIAFNSLTSITSAELNQYCYRQVTITVLDMDGQPVPGAIVYAYSRKFELSWPRLQFEAVPDQLWNLYDEIAFAKTNAEGQVTARLPPGLWTYVAAKGGDSLFLVTETTRDDKATLKAARTRKLDISVGGERRGCNCFWVRPDRLPIWIQLPFTGSSIRLKSSNDTDLRLWASGSDFLLNFGLISGNADTFALSPVGATRSIKLNSIESVTLCWWAADFGLYGRFSPEKKELTFTDDVACLGYQRVHKDGVHGEYVARPFTRDLELDLVSAPECFIHSSESESETACQLYVVDKNQYLLRRFVDGDGKELEISAFISNGRQEERARQYPRKGSNGNHTIAPAFYGKKTNQDSEHVWSFAIPGLSERSKPKEVHLVDYTSRHFKAQLPNEIRSIAEVFLAAADRQDTIMRRCVGRERKVRICELKIDPLEKDARATHDGRLLKTGTPILFSEFPVKRHDFDHELAHNYGCKHGGLQETLVEVSRCGPLPQIQMNQAKWFFFDRMNEIAGKEPWPGYPNTGLYFFCNSEGENSFREFIFGNEDRFRAKLNRAGFTDDEATTAILSMAMRRDLFEECKAYGLTVSRNRVNSAIQEITDFVGAKARNVKP